MSSFAHARRAVLLRRRLFAAGAIASVGSIWLLYRVLTFLFCGAPPCEGGIHSAIGRPACAGALGAEPASLLLLLAGTVLPAVVVVARWLRKRAKGRARTALAGGVRQPVVDRRAATMPSSAISSALRVRAPNRRRRLVAWLAMLGWSGASWLVLKVFWLSAAATVDGRHVLAAVALPIGWWLLEGTRVRPRTLAAVAPAFVTGRSFKECRQR